MPRIWFLFRTVRLTDQEMTATEKVILLFTIPNRRGILCQAEPHGEVSGSVRRQTEQEESIGQNFYCDVSQKRMGKAG